MIPLNNFFPPNVLVHISPRWQDFTLPKDRDELNLAQKNYLEDEVSLNPSQIFYGRQVHGNRILVVGAHDVSLKFPIQQADGFVTHCPGIALAVRTADCLSIFMYDPRKKAIGMIHVGWKGTEKRIVAEAIAILQKQYGTRPRDLLVGFGPCIRRCCYEVGADFRNIFPAETFEEGGRIVFDLALANRNQLIQAGVVAVNIHDEGLCTCCRREFYSYRREGDKAGRHVSVIMLCS